MALTRLGLNQSVNLASNVTGTLPAANGGTGATSFSPASFIKLAETNVTSSTASVEFTDATTGVFDDTYRTHVIFCNRLNPVDANKRLVLQMRSASSGSYLTSSYAYVTKAFDTGGGDRSHYATSGSQIYTLGGGNGFGDGSNEYGASCIIYCNDFTDSTTPPTIFGNGGYSGASGYNSCNYFSGTYRDTSTTIDGIKLFFNSGNIDHGCFTIYGVAK